MRQVLADINVKGHLDAISQFLRSGSWQEFWEKAAVQVRSFQGLELELNASDRVVWQTCQGQGIVLFTGNRNREGPDSLEETIRQLNQEDSLPVITLGDPDRFRRDRAYAERAAVKFLDYLLNLDQHRGAGRLYVP